MVADERLAGMMRNKIIAFFLVLSTLPLMLFSCGQCEHVWDEGYEAQAPNLEREGYRIITCTECGERKTESIPKLTHIEHTYSSKFGWDETHHWLICDVKDCATVTNKTEHIFVEMHGGGLICQACRCVKE